MSSLEFSKNDGLARKATEKEERDEYYHGSSEDNGGGEAIENNAVNDGKNIL